MNKVRQVLGAAPIPGSASTQASTVQAEDDLYGDDEPTAAIVQAPSPVPSPPQAQAPPPAAVHASAPAPAPATTVPASAPTTPASNAKGKQRAVAAPQAGLAASSTTTNSAQQAARAALQKKKREDAEELARIKSRIEQDKAARKAQAEARKAEREAERNASSPPPTQSRTTTSNRGSQAQNVNLNIRLFDGRTIRHTFPRTATLEKEVRRWVDEEFSKLSQDDPNIQNKQLPPYFFRHILPPQPSRELSAGDENQTLGDIDLAPSATLVLVPVKGYSDAYAGPGTNLLAGTTTGIVSGAFGLLSSTVGYAGSMLGSFLGTGNAAPQQPQGQTVGGGSSSSPQPESARSEREEGGIRVRTLADQRAREPRNQQFYNGNQVGRTSSSKVAYILTNFQSNVEPRPDDRG